MATGCDRDSCRRLEPADQGERAQFRVRRLRKGARDGGGETGARPQGGVEALVLNGSVHVREAPGDGKHCVCFCRSPDM